MDCVKFDKGWFKGADFSYTSLKAAAFIGADIRGTSFYGANLAKANLRAATDANNEFDCSQFLDRSGGSWDTFAQLPIRDCADLRGADFAGRPLVWVEIDHEEDNNPLHKV
jgi:uncharacterized protein YjbI with pentapeptide repeats